MADDDKKSPLEHRNDPELPPPTFPGSHMVIDDHYVFVSGLVAADVPGRGDAVIGDAAAETRFVLTELRRMLESVGCSMDRVVRADVHLTDMRDMEAMNEVYRQFFDPEGFPARTCTGSPRLFGDSRVEITLLARVGPKRM